MTHLEFMEQSVSEIALELFEMRHENKNPIDNRPELDECINDVVFIVNTYMRKMNERMGW
ncbi:hypothetical protein UFOVP1491_15 [uncultured Caudovirales phage]|uniref:Uncharacterized protein n=1 Tax=uncultured Caudovirales phage TaxID=2100421 RepID=A0A6J5RGM4_9CAUD|nr:hypothetical protein UFOVP485_106 [uncultured Caudovirales phage]CAB4150930.1 hypothetical protein UFOVP575_58 [uncultured Caudovirales phage]CAB4174968.1 hypothetical protein UFOVP963_102 [uncultured Caudovirales phage]CAB4179608.1 hypothetical protein UFOVP1032_15 [uncultured Caudovirales phage]CAB4185658.1 hypothetical protein UFOVP1125_83 [uncultured Caudovirales phage]